MTKRMFLFIFFMTAMMTCLFSGQMNVRAAGNDRPRVIISSYEVTNGGISPGESTTVTLTLQNTNSTSSAYGILLTCEYNDNVYPSYTSSNQAYVDALQPGETKTVEVKLSADDTLASNAVLCSVNVDFQDDAARVSSYNSTISIPVVEDALKINKIDVPQSMIVNGKGRISLTCENNTSNDIYNATMEIKSKDKVLSTTNIGNVLSGSRMNPDAYLSFDATGTYGITVELSYTDAQGNTIKKDTSEYQVKVTEVEKSTAADESSSQIVTGRNLFKIFAALGGMAVFGVLSIIMIFRNIFRDRR